MKYFTSNKAFTLIELVMVIVILGILAASAIPKFTNFSGKAHDAAVQGVIGGVTGGISIVQADNIIDGQNIALNYYPETLDNRPTSSTDSLFIRVLSPPINDKWLKTSGPSGSTPGSEKWDYTGKGTGAYVELTYTNNTGLFAITNPAH